ncbi:MAG TPA: hypothetical protein VGC32_13150 [Solirubrobacterales bacterium]
MRRRLLLLPLLLIPLGLAACGGGGSGGGSESEPPSLASIEKCLAAGKAKVEKGKSNPDEIVGKMPDKGLIIAFTFVHGQEGEEAAEALEESASEAAGGEREVETFHGGRAVISLSNHAGEEDLELAQSCVE